MHTILIGDAREQLRTLPDASVQCCVTSPPYYGLRAYLDADERFGTSYVAALVDVFREVKRVLRDDGTLWLNLGDSYAGGGRGGHSDGLKGTPPQGIGNAYPRSLTPDGLKPKDLIGVPWRVAFALQADGWYLRKDNIWHKPNPMPESVTDRTTTAHEYMFLLTKRPRYYYDAEAIAEDAFNTNKPGAFSGTEEYKDATGQSPHHGFKNFVHTGKRNKRSVWTVSTTPYSGAHFATFPPKLIEPCILAGSREGDTVLDPFVGSGTTVMVAERLGRHAIGIDLDPDNAALIAERTAQRPLWDALEVSS